VKTEYWVMPLVFLAVSIPTALVLLKMNWGGEDQLWIAVIAGGIATSYAQWRVRRAEQERRS
jgi:hypothetical protein